MKVTIYGHDRDWRSENGTAFVPKADLDLLLEVFDRLPASALSAACGESLLSRAAHVCDAYRPIMPAS